jgi:hypothetical protein
MDLATIVARIGIRLRDLGLTETEVSRSATNNDDTIRNWRRRVTKEKNPGASMRSVEAIARRLGVTVEWLQGAGPDDYDEYDAGRAELMKIYDQLPQDGPWRAQMVEDARRVQSLVQHVTSASGRPRKAR